MYKKLLQQLLTEIKDEVLKVDNGTSDIYKKLTLALTLTEYLQDIEVKKEISDEIVEKNSVEEINEINKVARKLPNWAKKPNQYNSTILKIFLDIYQENKMLKKDLIIEKIFEKTSIQQPLMDRYRIFTNLEQMIHIAPKNHAKVFDYDINDNLIIWEPVKKYVEDFYFKLTNKKIKL